MSSLSTTLPPGSLRSRPLPRWVRRVLGSPVLEALTTPHGVSSYLEQVSPAWSLTPGRAVVVDTRPESPDAVTLTLRPTDGRPLSFRAGQFVRVTAEVGGVRRTRCFSLSCSAHRSDGHFQITVKTNPNGQVSRYLVAHARPGLVLEVGTPEGQFTLPDPRPPRLTLISGGSGITPVMSMLRTLVDEDYCGEVAFLHYARTEQDVIFREELEQLSLHHPKLRLAVVLTGSKPGSLSRGLAGHFSGQHLRALDAGGPAHICGPQRLVDAVRNVWTQQGLRAPLHVERFHVEAPSSSNPGAVGSNVCFEQAGIRTANDGKPLLVQAERAGLRPDHGCRMGICHTCTCRLRTGRVRNLLTGEVQSEPGTEIQLCVSVPDGDVSLEL